LTCHFCCSVWISVGLLFYYQHFSWTRDSLLYLFAGAAGSYLLDRISLFLETLIVKNSGDH
jgi:hypothetical protein